MTSPPGRTATWFDAAALVRLTVGVLTGVLLAAAFLAAFGDSRPTRLPVAVTGEEGLTAGFLEAAERGTGDTFDFQVVPTAQELPELVRSREVYGAVVLMPESWQILYAGANGVQVNTLVTTITPGSDSGIAVSIEDVRPVTTDADPNQVVTFLLVAVVVAGVLFGAAGSARVDRVAVRLAAVLVRLLLLAVVLAALVAVLAVLLLDVLPGSVLVVGWYLALLVLVAGGLTAALARLLGVVGVGLSVVLLGLSLATAGSLAPTAYLPGGMEWLSAVLPLGAAATGLIGHSWFAGSGGGAAGATLVLWVAAVLALLALAQRVGERGPAPDQDQDELVEEDHE